MSAENSKVPNSNLQPAPQKPPSLIAEDDAQADGVCKPPFDLFGIQASFFINGEDKTVSWPGFISSIILVSAVITVSIFQGIYFLEK
jgi:hypothetical protein